MQMDGNDNVFKDLKNVGVELTNLSKSDELFFNSRVGSKVSKANYTLAFELKLPIMSIGSIKEESADKVHICGKLFWIGEPTRNKRGSALRNDIVKDDSGEIELTVWNPRIMDLFEDNKTYLIMNLRTLTFQSLIKVATTTSSVIEETDEVDVDVPNTKHKSIFDFVRKYCAAGKTYRQLCDGQKKISLKEAILSVRNNSTYRCQSLCVMLSMQDEAANHLA